MRTAWQRSACGTQPNGEKRPDAYISAAGAMHRDVTSLRPSMFATASQWLVIVGGLWLIGLGAFMLVQPRQALRVLGQMGGSPMAHFGELAVRILVGIAMVLAAAASRFPVAIAVIGSFLIVSALLLVTAPIRTPSQHLLHRWRPFAPSLPVSLPACSLSAAACGDSSTALHLLPHRYAARPRRRAAGRDVHWHRRHAAARGAAQHQRSSSVNCCCWHGLQ